MRRLASVFSKRDKDSKKDILDVELSTPSDPSHSSASSAGSASLSIQTPEDSPLSLISTPTAKSKSWFPWLPRKASVRGQWSPPVLRQPPLGNRFPPVHSDSDSASYFDDFDNDNDNDLPSSLPADAKSRQVLRILTENSLAFRSSSAPFVWLPSQPLYPRSVNTIRLLPSPQTLASTVHRKRLLRRLQGHLSPAEVDSIVAFSRRRTPESVPPSATQTFDERAPLQSERISSYSPGLRRWIERPPFEDRVLVWTVEGDSVSCQRVTNSKFALAALEFSEFIEAMADGGISSPPPPLQQPLGPLQTSPLEPVSPASDAQSSSSSASSHISSSCSHSKPSFTPPLLVPSPLRNQTTPMGSPTKPRQEEFGILSKRPVLVKSPVEMGEASSLASSNNTTKRGVRFAEDDKEDNIPIGYVMRIKKQREEKARFLREQKERRMFEDDRTKVEEERRRRDQERRQWEQERAAWEKEKRAMEEERKKRVYAEEVIAARQRAESSRNGMRISTSSASLREPERNTQESKRYSRAVYDMPHVPRRQGSEAAISPSSSPSPRNSSPGSSRSPSIAGHSNAGGSNNLHPQHAYSRPTSLHSAVSSEDVRLNKRHSAASVSSHRPSNDRTASYPVWSGSHSSLLVPPVPQIPPADMPLLPPSAPFMMNHYSRRSNHSLSPVSNGSSSSRPRLPSNGSSDSLNRRSIHSRQDSSPARRSEHGSAPPSPASSPHRTHRRRTSDDSSRRLSLANTSSSSHSPPSAMSRGRPMHPAYMQQNLPSPWTAMPSQLGRPPTTMPYTMPSSHSYVNIGNSMRFTPTRSQTAFS